MRRRFTTTEPRTRGDGAAVAVVATLRGDPQRNAALVRDADDRLDLLDAVRLHDRRGLVLVPRQVPERVAELAQVRRLGEHVLGCRRRRGRSSSARSSAPSEKPGGSTMLTRPPPPRLGTITPLRSRFSIDACSASLILVERVAVGDDRVGRDEALLHHRDEARQVVAHAAVAVLGAEDRPALDGDRRPAERSRSRRRARRWSSTTVPARRDIRTACVWALASVAASST